MPIKNLSNIRRLPRLGKISLGIKKTTKKDGTECPPYPSEVDYFVCPIKVQKVFGEKPKELKIMFPIENADIFFQQWYKSYGYNLLKCKGDGETAHTWDEEKGGMKQIACPCEKLETGDCKRIGILQFLLPDVPGAGVWQISTSSRNSIIDINSGISFIKSVCGRIRMIPLILKRVEMVTQRIEKNGQPKKGTHYTLQIDLADVSLRQLQEAAMKKPEQILLPPPDESKDESFFPDNGFEKEEEKDQEKQEEIESPNSKESQEEKQGDEKQPELVLEQDEDEKAKDEAREKLSAELKKFFKVGGKALVANNQRLADRLDYIGDKTNKEVKLAEIEGGVEFIQLKIKELERTNRLN